jgi:hypothetical protein
MLLASVFGTSGFTKGLTPPDIAFFSKLGGIDSVKLIRDTEYGSKIYELWFRQQIDHNNLELGTFPQRVLFEHRDYVLPVVVVIEGYSIHSLRPSEPAKLLNANQLTIEHRFFAKSRPTDSIPWGKLNIFNAANDHHAIIQTFKPFYKNKWVSTGISKGGQAAIFHRFFFPEDVDVSIPYVAPVNYSDIDDRVFLFLDTVSTPECRQRIFNFQVELFKRKQQLMSNFRQEIAAKNWSFPMSVDSAYDLSVFEFSFAWWQWGNGRCNEIPETTAHDTILYNYFSKSGAADFFTIKGIETNLPFFYQALTEIGMYGYETRPFQNYTSLKGIVGFEFTLPEGYRSTKFNPNPMRKVDEWVKTKGNTMLYIYGGFDAWSSTAAQPGTDTNSFRFFNPAGNHATRIASFPNQMQDSIVRILGNWLEMEIDPPYKK